MRGVLVDGLSRMITHLHAAHCIFHTHQVHASLVCLFLLDYDEPIQTDVGKVVYDPDINANIFSL
jgi:hypothetical protein